MREEFFSLGPPGRGSGFGADGAVLVAVDGDFSEVGSGGVEVEEFARVGFRQTRDALDSFQCGEVGEEGGDDAEHGSVASSGEVFRGRGRRGRAFLRDYGEGVPFHGVHGGVHWGLFCRTHSRFMRKRSSKAQEKTMSARSRVQPRCLH